MTINVYPRHLVIAGLLAFGLLAVALLGGYHYADRLCESMERIEAKAR